MGERLSTFARGSEEFGRVLAFSDGLFAIAMTLLVVGIDVPDLSDKSSISELADALDDDATSFVSFVISFLVIGRYWTAHHLFFARLKAMNRGLVALNMVYLLFIAFLPFPTGLLGNYFENPLSIAIYAVAVAFVCGMVVVLFHHARRHGLMTVTMPDDVYRWGAVLSLSPVLFFLISIPIAFIDTGLAVAVWFGAIPFQAIAARYRPERADEFF
jgi:uncharacterized membrane protein